jgi:minor extracellular serine protease Vpr
MILKITAICVLILGTFSMNYSQAKMNASAQLFLNEVNKIDALDNSERISHLVQDYDLIKFNGQFYIGVLTLVDINLISKNELTTLGVINDTRLENLWTMRVPIIKFAEFIELQGIQYIEIGEPVSPLLVDAVPDARVDSVHLGLGDLSRAYTGKGVIVAIIDWGFDYTHPNFYDTAFNGLRLSRAWDQNKLSGPSPQGYSFGTEYLGQSQLLAAEQDTLYVFGPGSHGTHVAGIAGGTGAGTIHGGAAFESELIFISLRRDAPSLIDAFSYITNYAASVNKPYVVNMSFGSHLGPHDGTSLKNYGIDILHGPGKVFVGSAGNNGTATSNFHLDYDFSVNPSDTIKTVVGFDNVSDMFGQTLSMWGSAYSSFGAAIRIVNSSNQFIYETPFYHSSLQPFVNDTILIGVSDTLIIRIQSTGQHFLNNKPNIRMEVKKTGNYKVVLMATSEESHLHVWNNVRLNNRYTNWGVALTGGYPGALVGNNDYGLGEPGGVGKNVITVGSYRAQKPTGTGNFLYGQISSFSSKGPTVDNRTKPDITSTGGNVYSSVNSFDPTYNSSNFLTPVIFEGKTYGFISFSGTSMSGPMVAGIVALMLEAHPRMSATQVKEVLKATARLDQYTGVIGSGGHLQWGWGKANALAAVKAAELYSSIEEISIEENLFQMYPNPAQSEIVIQSNQGNSIHEITIYSLDGSVVEKINVSQLMNVTIPISSLSSGVYLISIQSDTKFEIKQLVVAK